MREKAEEGDGVEEVESDEEVRSKWVPCITQSVCLRRLGCGVDNLLWA